MRAKRARGSPTHHLDFRLSNTPLRAWLRSFAAPRLNQRLPKPRSKLSRVIPADLDLGAVGQPQQIMPASQRMYLSRVR
jgi:hypothetical protein